MFILKNVFYSILLFINCLCLNGVVGDCVSTMQENVKDANKVVLATRSLTDVFRSLRDTIPEDVLQSNLVSQSNEILKFIKSPEFDAISDAISNSGTYRSGLQYLKSLGVQTDNLENVASLVRSLLYPYLEGNEVLPAASKMSNDAEYGDVESYDYLNEDDEYTDDYLENDLRKRTLSRKVRCVSSVFANRIASIVPKELFQQRLNEHLFENPEFAKFYRIIRVPKTQSKILRSLSKASLKHYTRLLKTHNIDVKAWLTTIFKVLSFGPRYV